MPRPIAVVEDTWGNVYLPDGISRVPVFYPALAPINAANFLNPGLLAPGMIAAMFSHGYHEPVRWPAYAEFHVAAARYAERCSGTV